MAKTAEFQIGGTSFSAGLTKLDRKKVYGWSEVKVYDERERECSLASISRDGRYILPSGSVALGVFSEEGDPVVRKELTAVNDQGEEMTVIPSIFDAPVAVRENVSIEEYLECNVKSVYQLEYESIDPAILARLSSGEIFACPFNYRADYIPDDAYLLMNDDALFLIVGNRTHFEFTGLQNAAVPESLADEDEENEDDFDFGML